jgi:RNA polymerase sigma-70 factor (ECF subfamily)
MKQEQESEIINRILKGDREAYALLVEKYKGPIFNLAFRMTGNYQDAEDLGQETFIRAYEALIRFNRKKRFFPWLYTIGLNLIRNHLNNGHCRLSGNPIESDQDALWENRTNPEHITGKHQEMERLSFCVHKLPVELREVVVLRYYEELPFEDIKEIAGISLSASKMRVYRGLEKLRLLMKSGFGTGNR